MEVVVSTTSATYDDQDRMSTYGTATYAYTTSGDLLTKTDPSGVTTFDYDALGNLRSATLSDGRVIEYLIDAQNRRVGKKVNGTVVRRWLYSGQLRVVAELDGAGTLISRFVYGTRTNVPDYMIRNGVTLRFEGWWTVSDDTVRANTEPLSGPDGSDLGGGAMQTREDFATSL